MGATWSSSSCSADDLPLLAARLEQTRRLLADQAVVRTACFTSRRPADDLTKLAAEQAAELLVVSAPIEAGAFDELAAAVACDIALAARPELAFTATGPILVPFGGGKEEWAAVELGAWFARSTGRPLRLVGAHARDDRRDASRTLASASLALQRFTETAAETVLVAAGAEGILAEAGSAIVASLPPGELDATRQELVRRTTSPLLLVRAGPRPGGLAPARTLTRFSWSLQDESS